MSAENDALIAKHADDLLVTFLAPDIGISFSQEQLLYVTYRGGKIMLTGCNIFFYGNQLMLSLSSSKLVL